MVELESLHTCPAGEVAASPSEKTVGENQQVSVQSLEPLGSAGAMQTAWRAAQAEQNSSLPGCPEARDPDDPSRITITLEDPA